MHRFFTGMPKNALLLSLGIVLLALASCGSTTTASTSTLSSTDATATACVQVTRPVPTTRTATGVLKSLNGQTLVVTNNKGNDVTITYSNTTRFTQVNSIAASSLQEGTAVRVAVTSTNGSYTATNITLIAATNGTGNGFPRGNGNGRRGNNNNPCIRRTQNGNGNGTPGFRGLIGTVSQVNGTTLVVADTTGASYTVTITPQTQILQTQSATAASLKVGVLLTAVGRADSQGVIAANTIALLPNIPNATATPVE